MGDVGLEPAGPAAACTTLLLDLRLPALVLLLPRRRPGVDADTRVADEAREASDATPAPPAGGACATSAPSAHFVHSGGGRVVTYHSLAP